MTVDALKSTEDGKEINSNKPSVTVKLELTLLIKFYSALG
jgi:hypothetical protein